MMRTHRRPLFALAAVVLLAAPLAAQGVQAQRAAQAPALTVHAIWGTREFASDLVSLAWMKDGAAYTTTEDDASGNTDLNRVDAVSGKTQVLVRGADLVPPGARQPVAIEEYAFSADGSKLLVFTNTVRVWRQNTKGTYYVWDFAAKRLIPVSTKPGYQMFAKFAPDGRTVGFVRDNNIYVTDLATGSETPLTTDGGDNVINGTSDWVYEEELDLRDAFRWSPDGRRIAFWRLDQTAIRPFYLINDDSLYPELLPVRYPKAGAPNSTLKIGVVDVATRETRWVDLGPDRDIYVAAMDFAASPDELWLTRLNRRQNRLDLLLADARSGASRVIMSDSDSAWVDANQPRWIDGGRQFLFVSER
ncbi:MAG TPA: DPP IV N-terminal domain-containing protein, partial [Gemmatimonadales bacterium]|nr:DPP IV N-terminal domain-containing protein [Gemmatimonadales bacterium]